MVWMAIRPLPVLNMESKSSANAQAFDFT